MRRPSRGESENRRSLRTRARELAARRAGPRPAHLVVPYHGGQSETSAPRATVSLVSTDAWREPCLVESWGESRALAVERAIRYAYERTGVVYIPQPREHGWTAARARRELDADDA
jgi:hypothetical protein